MEPIAVITTVGSRAEAQAMALALVERQLVACAQIEEIESFYTWDGAVQNAVEFRLTFKTLDTQYAAVGAAIKALHSYELPAIHAVSLSMVYPPYGRWVSDNAQGR